MNPLLHIEPRDLRPLWKELAEQASTDSRRNIAFPGATDLTHEQLAELEATVLYNNIGSPYDEDGHGRNHTKAQEREVVDLVADLFGAPESRWGYVTSGATEGTRHALLDARRMWPNTVVYSSAASHYKVDSLTEELMMPLVVIPTHGQGRINLDVLAGELARRRDRAAIIVAVAGTTMTEAVDDVAGIAAVCEQLAIRRRRIHVDAALSGLPLALEPAGTPAFDFTVPGVSSIIVSGHKFLSTLIPCGVLVYREPPLAASRARVSYTGTSDVTIPGSRSGHTTLRLLAVLAGLGTERHRQRALACRAMASYAHTQLRRLGVDARRGAHAFTVYFPPLPASLGQRWVLPTDDRHGHIICMPQVTREVLDEFLGDVEASIAGLAAICGHAPADAPPKRGRRRPATAGAR